MDDFSAEKDEVIADDQWADRWINFIAFRGPHLAKCKVIDVDVIEVEEVA